MGEILSFIVSVQEMRARPRTIMNALPLQQVLFRRSIGTSSVSWGWRDFLSGRSRGQDPSSPPVEAETAHSTFSHQSHPLGVADHLKQLALTHLPQNSENWEEAPLDNIAVKTKILLSCESTFGKTFPDTKLGSLRTVGDVLRFLQSRNPQRRETFFPDVDRSQVPPNLSFHSPEQHTSRPKQKRVPFQNYDSPVHSRFPRKESRKHVKQHQ